MQYIGNTDIAMKYCNRFPILLQAIYCSKPLAARWRQQHGGNGGCSAAAWRQRGNGGSVMAVVAAWWQQHLCAADKGRQHTHF
jgi:hypothetical protein